MKYAIAALASVIGPVIGWVVAAAGFITIGGAARISDFEGQRSMLATSYVRAHPPHSAGS